MNDLVQQIREYAESVGVSFEVALKMLSMAHQDSLKEQQPLYWVCPTCGETEAPSCRCGG